MADRKGLAQANILRSNNTTQTGYGIVYADEVSGHRQVANLDALYKLFDWQLSASGNNTGKDAIGQLWYVVDADGSGNGNLYQLVNWEKRNTSDGWRVFTTSTSVDLSDYQTTAQADSKYATKDSLNDYVKSETYKVDKGAIESAIENCVKSEEIGTITNEDLDGIWKDAQNA